MFLVTLTHSSLEQSLLFAQETDEFAQKQSTCWASLPLTLVPSAFHRAAACVIHMESYTSPALLEVCLYSAKAFAGCAVLRPWNWVISYNLLKLILTMMRWGRLDILVLQRSTLDSRDSQIILLGNCGDQFWSYWESPRGPIEGYYTSFAKANWKINWELLGRGQGSTLFLIRLHVKRVRLLVSTPRTKQICLQRTGAGLPNSPPFTFLLFSFPVLAGREG